MSEIMKCDVCGKIKIPIKIDVIAKRTWIIGIEEDNRDYCDDRA